MRLATLLTILCVLPGAAGAQTTQCQAIPTAAGRLACYDKATPPQEKRGATKPASAATTDRTAQSESDKPPAPLADLLAIENARMDAKIKNICRGC